MKFKKNIYIVVTAIIIVAIGITTYFSLVNKKEDFSVNEILKTSENNMNNLQGYKTITNIQYNDNKYVVNGSFVLKPQFKADMTINNKAISYDNDNLVIDKDEYYLDQLIKKDFGFNSEFNLTQLLQLKYELVTKDNNYIILFKNKEDEYQLIIRKSDFFLIEYKYKNNNYNVVTNFKL